MSATKHPHTPIGARRPGPNHPQTGASLLMVLIFMLVLSVLAIFGVRNVSLLERQALNEQEYQLARQAAEAALRDGEMDLGQDSFGPSGATCSRAGSKFRENREISPDEFTDTCLLGQCGVPVSRYQVSWSGASSSNPGAPWWPASKGGQWGNNASASGEPNFNCTSATGGVPLGTFTGTPRIPRVARQPEYLIEYLEPESTNNVPANFKCPNQASSGSSAVKSAANEDSGGSPDVKVRCYVFRITARGFGMSTTNDSGIPNPRVEVVMQSYVQLLRRN